MKNLKDRLPFGLALALCGLSAATSGVGLWWIFDQNIDSPSAAIGAAAVATLVLQALIVCFWNWASSFWNWKRRIVAGVFGVAASLASAGFAGGSYLYAINKTGLEEHLTQQSASAVVGPLARFGADLRDLAARMDAISLQAQQKANREEQVGGTCLGDTPQVGFGPRTRLRQRHAREAEDLASRSRGIADQAVEIIHALQGDPSRQGMLRTFRAAHDLASHRDLTAIAAWLHQEAAGFNGEFTDPDNSQPFVCRDPQLQTGMSEAASLVTKGFNLPAVPPEPASVTVKDAIGKSYRDAFEFAWMVLAGDPDPDRYESLSYSIAGYAPALAVELFIIVLLFFRTLAERDAGGGWTRRDVFNLNSRDLPPALRRCYRIWVDLMLKLMLEDGKRSYFARPIDGAPDVVRQCNELALLLELPVDSDMKPAIPLADIYPEWVASQAKVHGGARWFALHPITREEREWLCRAARDLAEPEDASADDGAEPKVVRFRNA